MKTLKLFAVLAEYGAIIYMSANYGFKAGLACIAIVLLSEIQMAADEWSNKEK